MSAGHRHGRRAPRSLHPDEPDDRDTKPQIIEAEPRGSGRTTGKLPSTADTIPHNGLPSERLDGPPMVAGLPLARPVEQTPEEAFRLFRARRRSFLWAGLILLTLLLIVEMILLSPWTDPVAGLPLRNIASVPLAEVNPYGVNVFLHKEVDNWKKEKTLDMARDMGASWIKQQFPWAELEFSKGNFYDTKNNQSAWAKFDSIVDLAEQRGLRIIARLDSTPEWARTDDSMPPAVRDAIRPNPKVPPSAGHLEDFKAFVNTFVSRYKGRVAAVQIWNEPNLASEWPTGVDAGNYVKLLQAGYEGAKSADPNVIVLAAPLAMNNEQLSYAGNLNELDYLQAMYYAGARNLFDVMSANAYGKEFPPEDPPSREKLNFRRVELLHLVMARSGDTDKAIWFNEYGWNASPADLPEQDGRVTYPWGRVTPDQQAQYTVGGIEYAREHWPWAGLFTIWYLRQVGDVPQTHSDYYFSLVNPEFVPSTAYRAVQRAAEKSAQAATPGDWGPLSSPVQAGARWQIGLSPAVPGGAYVAPSSTSITGGDALNIAFRGTDVSLQLVPPASPLTGTTAAEARYYVSVDGNSSEVAKELPRDSAGRAYIQLPPGGQATTVTVVRGLGSELTTGEHSLQVSVLPTSGGASDDRTAGVASPLQQAQSVALPGIAFISVKANRSYFLFGAMTALLLAGIGFEVWALRRSQAAQASRGGGARRR